MQFLLIEDDEVLIELLTVELEKQSYGVVVARNGLAGKRMAESTVYDLILLDVGLPGMNGIKVCQELRQAGNFVPIILLTARSSKTDKLLGLEVGASDYVVKPIDFEVLMTRIQAVLSREERSLRYYNQPTFEASDTAFTAELAQIWERTKDTTFNRIEELLEILQSLEKGELDETTRERMQRNTHKLAGSLGTFGFAEGSTIAQSLQYIFIQVQDAKSCLEQARPLILKLQQVVMATDQSLVAQSVKNTPTIGSPPMVSVPNSYTSRNLPQPFQITNDKVQRLSLKNSDYILLADGDRSFTQALYHEASSWKLEFKTVHNAMELCRTLERSLPKVLVLNLAVVRQLNDWQELQRILKRSSEHPALVILSEQEGLVNRLKGMRLNADVFLQKPATSSQVFAAVARAIGSQEDHPVKVLVVDDDIHITELLKELLSKVNFQVNVLNEPLDFWEYLGNIQPDLLILDVTMPSLDGLTLCHMIRRDFQWSWLPILFLTGHDNVKTLEEAFATGADDFITKPINPEGFIERVVNRWQRSQLYRNQMDTDFLTGIANRNGGSRSFSHLLQLARQSQQPFSLAVLDLDHFKQLNDRFGHEEGDLVLRQFGEFLKKHCRAGDMLARWGGEEFIIGMLGLSREGGAKRMNEIREEWHTLEFISTQGDSFRVTFSGGVAQYPLDGSDFQVLYRTADAALYQAKAAGRNLVLPAL